MAWRVFVSGFRIRDQSYKSPLIAASASERTAVLPRRSQDHSRGRDRLDDYHTDVHQDQGCIIRDFRLYASRMTKHYICSILFKRVLCIVNRWSVLACKCPFGSEHESKSIWRALVPTKRLTEIWPSHPGLGFVL